MLPLESLVRAIITAWNANADLNDYPLVYQRGLGTDYPQAAFTVSASSDHTIASTIDDLRITFTLFDDSPSAATLHTLMGKVDAAYNHLKLTGTGWQMASRMQRESTEIFINDSDHWEAAISYRCRVSAQ